MSEFVCKRCGIQVVCLIDTPDMENETCQACTFVSKLNNVMERGRIARILSVPAWGPGERAVHKILVAMDQRCTEARVLISRAWDCEASVGPETVPAVCWGVIRCMESLVELCQIMRDRLDQMEGSKDGEEK